MSQRPPRDPRLPPTRSGRTGRPRSAVIGPPTGYETGSGYNPNPVPTTTYQFPRPPRRVSSPPSSPPSTTNMPATGLPRQPKMRPDPEIFDPVMPPPPSPPPQSSRRRQKPESMPPDTPTVMFYPSTTTLSSVDSEPFVEPMPFFKNDPRLRGSGVASSIQSSVPPTPQEFSERTRTISTVSSGVLGPGTVEVDIDTGSEDDEDETSSTDSSYDHLVRSVSTVRRGQARIIRNFSARRSVVPEVYFLFSKVDV